MGKKNTIVVSSSDDEDKDKDFLLNSNISYSKSKTRPSSIPRTNTQSAKSTRLSGSCSRSRKKSNGFDEVVWFRSLEKPKEDEFCLELSKLHKYDDVVERVASHLSMDDPSKIRLTSHNCYTQQPKPQPLKYQGVEHLSDMLKHFNKTSDILYYEVLDIPLPELQSLKTLKIAFHHATKDEVVIHTIRLPKQSTVGDAINELKTKVELSHPNVELRLFEVLYHKIYKIFPLNENIGNINDQYWTFHAEEIFKRFDLIVPIIDSNLKFKLILNWNFIEQIPEEEKNLGPHDCLIHVYHFMKDTALNHVVHNFGEPFLLVIHEGEILKEVKVRIQKKLQVPDELFSKDSDILSSCFQRRDVYGVWEQYLGLEHSDNAPERSDAASQVVGKSRWNTDLIETSSSSSSDSSSSDSDEDFDEILDVMAINLLMEFENSF